MNSDNFLFQVKNRLLPTLRALYPGRKIVLVLGNASYHHGRGDDWISPNNVKRVDLAA